MADQKDTLIVLIDASVSLSKKLIELVEEKNWQEFEKVENQRRVTLEQINNTPIPDHLVSFTRENVEKIKQIDTELIVKVKACQDLTHQALRTLQQGNKAIKAYLEK